MKIRPLLDKCESLAAWLQSPALLLIRLAWGFQLFESGRGHLTHVAQTAQQFAEWHIPFPTLNVYLSGSVELGGGILLMLGLFSRFISVPLFLNFCVAYATASPEAVKSLLRFESPDDFINDSAFPFLVTSLLILAFGAGRLSLDALLFRKAAGAK